MSRQTPVHRLPELERLRALQSAVNQHRDEVVDVKYHLGNGQRETLRCVLHCVALSHLPQSRGGVMLVTHSPDGLGYEYLSASCVVSVEPAK